MDAGSALASWWAWIGATTLQATVLLAGAWLADVAVRRRAWPQLVATLWLVALARLVLPAEFSSPWSVTESVGRSTQALASASLDASLIAGAFAVWACGLLAILIARARARRRALTGIERVELDRRWSTLARRAATRVRLRTLPRIATLDGLASPAVVGALVPTLLVPRAWLERAPTVRDEHALLHEFTHLRRRDLWLDEALALVRAVFWFHPLVWLAAARVRASSELACDQAVARVLGAQARDYRDTLVLAARRLLDATTPAGARAFAAGSIVARIESLDRGCRSSTGLARGVSAATAIAIAACVLPMAPRAADLREQARAVFAAEQRGEIQSCFALQAAAMVLAEPSDASTPTQR